MCRAVEYLDAVEDVGRYAVFDSQLLAGRVDMATVDELARVIGRVHCATHVATIGEAGLARLASKFS